MICTKCQIRMMIKPFSDYSETICWFCWLKTHKKYKDAAKLLGNSLFNWSTKISSRRIGWSFYESAHWTMIFTNILNHPGLNKTCKVPKLTKGYRKDGWPQQLTDSESLKILNWSDWRVSTALNYLLGR